MANPSPAITDDPARRAGNPGPTWLPAGSETASLIASRNWSDTALGSPERWTSALSHAARLCLESAFPLAIAWGPARTQIYNDAFAALCGAQHPRAFGRDMRECWASAWPVLGPLFERAYGGSSSLVEDARLLLDRGGALEESFFTLSFSPLRDADEDATVAGVLLTIVETTSKVLRERRTALLRDLVVSSAGAATTREALGMGVQVLEAAACDVPFAVVYSLDAGGNEGELTARTREAPEACCPARFDLSQDADVPFSWRSPLKQAIGSSSLQVVSLAPGEARPETALLLPITLPGAALPCAVLLAAKSPRLALDDDYRAFFVQVAEALARCVLSARAQEEQRRRADHLSALDRAKTAFFSNVSHELRTPLNLLIGPIEDELAEREQPLPEPRRERLSTAQRNAKRLLKLVNVLLDFSRIEAGRALARYRPTQLGTLTSELASMFRSAVERAGLTLDVIIEPRTEPVFVDREMWEKIVLNLLSNAFKHTFDGGIVVSLRFSGDRAQLSVVDTGIGIDEQNLPLLFDRFHRVAGVQSRTQEGTGIGLALVRELSRLHGGEAQVESQVGRGSTFTVTIPLSSAHLPSEQVELDVDARPSGVDVTAYVQEALQWSRPPVEISAPQSRDADRPPLAKVLIADDNADMRAYVSGLLKHDYDVVSVSDGATALELVRDFQPDLVLTDVMMPRLDGAGLLRALRGDAKTRQLPVILLSARAGEDAPTEGIEAGADDYLVKPFSARELLARVRTHVELARIRREWAEQLEQNNQELEAFSYSVSHDLRTPLRAIDGFSKAIMTHKSAQLDDEAKHYLARVRKAAGRMSELIDELLNLSRISRAPLQRQVVSLSTVAKSVAEELSEQQPQRAVHFEAEAELTAHADPRLLRIVLENLLENSWKFTARCGHATVRVGQLPGSHPPTYFVEDNGAGFDQAYAHRLFQPFQRLHADSDYPGTGIGTAIVHRIVTRHGGQIWAEGREDQGATFYFTLSGKT